MFSLRALSIILSATTSVSSAGILFPLYIYPGNSCSGWSAVSSAIKSYPDLTFYIVVNPASGPGSQGSQPDANYQACIPTLKYSNSIVVGYVDTGDGTRASSLVTGDIDTYVGWSSTYSVQGIFFDQVSNANSYLSTYTSYSTYARRSFNFVILNPGTAIPSGYYSIADLILSAENYYSSFSTSQLVIGSSTPASKQAVVLHSGPVTPDTTLIAQLVQLGIGAIFMTDITLNNNPYGSLPTDWSLFVQDVHTANSG